MPRFAAGPSAPAAKHDPIVYVAHRQVKVTSFNGCGRSGTSAPVRHDSSAHGEVFCNMGRARWCRTGRSLGRGPSSQSSHEVTGCGSSLHVASLSRLLVTPRRRNSTSSSIKRMPTDEADQSQRFRQIGQVRTQITSIHWHPETPPTTEARQDRVGASSHRHIPRPGPSLSSRFIQISTSAPLRKTSLVESLKA